MSEQDMDWDGLFGDIASLLDAIEKAVSAKDWQRAMTLVMGRFSIMEAYGFKVEYKFPHTDKEQ